MKAWNMCLKNVSDEFHSNNSFYVLLNRLFVLNSHTFMYFSVLYITSESLAIEVLIMSPNEAMHWIMGWFKSIDLFI